MVAEWLSAGRKQSAVRLFKVSTKTVKQKWRKVEFKTTPQKYSFLIIGVTFL